MTWRAALLLWTSTTVAVAWWLYVWFTGGADTNRVMGAQKIALELAVATSFFCLPRRRACGVLERLAFWCERRPRAALGVLLAGVYVVAWLTTPHINYGSGQQGLGYGDDGAYYGWMTEHFSWSSQPVLPPYSYRPLVPFLVHASGLPPFTAYKILNAVSHALSGLFVYGIARRYTPAPGRALVAVSLFVVLKFGVKFWIYYPVLTDGVGTAFLLGALHATLAGRQLAYVAAMSVGIFCRENLVVLVGFNVLHAFRTRRDPRALVAVLASQVVPIGLFILSRVRPVFPPVGGGDTLGPMLFFLKSFLFSPDRQTRAFYAHLNALGALLVIPVLSTSRLARFLYAEYEWAYYLVATVALLTIGGTDYDRFAYWQAPLLVVALTRLRWTRPRDGWLWLHVLVLHAVAMELFLWWSPRREFYLASCAAHASGAALGYLEAGWVLLVAILAAMLAATSRRTARGAVSAMVTGEARG